MTIAAASTSPPAAAGIALERRCACPGGNRRLPIRVSPGGLAALHRALASSGVDPNAEVLTFRCGDCRTVVSITARDLYLVD